MNRRRIIGWLATLVALSGVLPIVLLALAGLRIVDERGVESSQTALEAVATQAAARISTYAAQQRELLRTLAMAVADEPDAERRLRDAALDSPSLGKVRMIGPDTPQAELPQRLGAAQIARALEGKEVVSQTYVVELAPRMDACVPCGIPHRAVCATLDLLELQREVQRIRLGKEGWAIAFDRTGALLAAGEGTMRAAVLTAQRVPESALAEALLKGGQPARRLIDRRGRDLIAGWSALPDLGWAVAVEQPADEALRPARAALLLLALGALVSLAVSLALGAAQAKKLLVELELEERFRTAGRLAAGITHDLGHRLAILQQTEQLARTLDADYLPRIRDSLAAEVQTLRRFVAGFSDLSREANPAEFLPMELNAFARSVASSAQPLADEAGVQLEVQPAPRELWVHGDRFLLERAALNLVRNAIEASESKSRVELRLEDDAGLGRLRVVDHGQGIERERLAHLFESFHSTKRTGAHVGMGLPNVKRITLAHGGAVNVASEPGRGSTFTLSLPLQSSPSA